MCDKTRFTVYYWYERLGKWIVACRTNDDREAAFQAEFLKKLLKTRTKIEEAKPNA